MSEPIVIIGAGQAGAQAAISLRQAGYDGDLILLGDERQPPYQRPPLSKKFLAGEIAEDQLFLRPEAFWEAQSVDLRTGLSVSAIDPDDRSITLDGDKRISYAKLLIATGSRARPLPVAGADLSGIVTLRSIDDVDHLRPRLEAAERLVIIGAGYIGLEVAAVARSLGHPVTVVEAMERVMQRVVSPTVSTFFDALHRDHGVDIRLNLGLDSFMGGDRLEGVRLADGTVIEADLALVAVGGMPDCALAAAAGLSCDNGILVDETCRTSAADIYAAGDCTNFPSALYGRRIRLESVQNAIDQAKAAAQAIIGEAVTYDPVPWFWSDQYDIKLQIAGLSHGYDRAVVDGDLDAAKFSVSYVAEDGRLLAVDAINDARAHMMSRRAIGKPYAAG